MSAVDSFGIVGTIIAEKYRVDAVVDEGGFSVVYKAEHLIWREPVALKCFKVLSTAPADQRDQLLDAFIQEGKLMTSLSSRSAAIVQARDIGKLTTKDGQWIPYIVMEWLDGKPLDVVLYQEGRASMPARTLPEAMRLLEPAAVAFDTCHARNIAHRDIKPGNLIVMGDPRGPSSFVKVLDFGIAKVMADHAAQQTASAHTGKEITAFTPNYGAPEQFSRTHGATGPWTDVFAMGLILVEVLRGGRQALEGGDFLQLGMASRDPMRRPTPRTYGIEVSDAVEAVFQRALAINPDQRFKTMGELWAALHQALTPGAPQWTGGGRPSMASAPGPTPSSPGGFPGHPQSFPGHPQSFQGHPQSLQGHPQSVPGHPPSMPVAPASGVHPQTGAPVFSTGQPAPIATHPNSYSTPQTASNPMMVAATAQPPRSRAGVLFGAIAAVAMIGGAAGAYWLLGKTSADSGEAGSGAAMSATAPASASAPAPASASASASAAPARLTECPKGMVLVPGGKFYMGSDEQTFKLWTPAHKVTLDTFCIDIYEVTAEAYKACSDKGECKRPAPVPDYPKSDSTSEADHTKAKTALAEMCNFGKPGREKHPINCVSWSMADEYCRVNDRRLPTEAEWELAARSHDGRKFPWGDDPVREGHMNACGKECNAWEKAHGLKLTPAMYDIDDGYPGTAPVGSFPEGKTKYGAYDVVGNVWEWTADWFETYKPDEQINPKGAPAGNKKAIRGGGWNGGVPLWLNPAFRYHQLATATAPGIGFRCARSL
ncbi:MAG: SUMF1/EgtB/PvdO family nonheme iron enzyme [Polyangiaceae bacterium]